jgi:2-haloacid dehalogenase
MVPELIARHPDLAHLIEAYAARFNETISLPIVGSHELVRRLSDNGVPLFALTNFGAEFFSGFRPTQPIFELFSDIIVSGVERFAKPDPRIYEIAEARFGFPPEALFFTDDNPANIAAASKRGWRTHLFQDAPALEAALTAQGLF